MTTTNKWVENQARLSADLPAVLYGVLGQSVNSNLADALTPFFDSKNGRAVMRNRGARAPKKIEVAPLTTQVDELAGEKSYVRPNGDKYFTRKWGNHSDVEVLRLNRTKNFYTMFYGAPGCGKTALVEAAFGEDLYTILGSGDTEVADFVGSYVQLPDGNFDWVDGPLVKAAEEGKVILIDEIGLIDPKVLTALYGLMDGRREISITANPERGTIKAKEGFFVVAATNPNAPGVIISEALSSRFGVQVEMTTDWSLAKKLGVPQTAVTCAQNLAKKQASDEISWAPQMRELLYFRDVAETLGTEFAVANLIAIAPEIDRPVVADVFSRVFGEVYKPARI